MSQTQSPSAWCAELQAKLMAALDAAWALAETTDDPTVIAKVRDKARLCGQMAAEVRKIAAMVPQPKPHMAKPRQLSATIHEALDDLDAGKPLAAQAMAMQALKKLKRR